LRRIVRDELSVPNCPRRIVRTPLKTNVVPLIWTRRPDQLS